jgi:hypothetical protein
MNVLTGDCPGCGEAAGPLAHAIVAPFITDLLSIDAGQPSRLMGCSECGLKFFDLRYDDAQMAAIYSDYRESKYVESRRRWEPWYSSRVNEAYDPDSPAVQDRREFIEGILRDGLGDRSFTCAVDYGGDEGQFFPIMAIGDRMVCDVSNRPLAPGVVRIPEISSLGERRADLVILAHVVEHLSCPLELVVNIKKWMADGGILYVEIPLDEFKVNSFHASNGYRQYLGWVARSRTAFIVLDFGSGLSRQLRSTIPAMGIVKQSEHINYFSPSSLRTLLEAAGFSIVADRVDSSSRVGNLKIGRYGVAVRK